MQKLNFQMIISRKICLAKKLNFFFHKCSLWLCSPSNWSISIRARRAPFIACRAVGSTIHEVSSLSSVSHPDDSLSLCWPFIFLLRLFFVIDFLIFCERCSSCRSCRVARSKVAIVFFFFFLRRLGSESSESESLSSSYFATTVLKLMSWMASAEYSLLFFLR